MGPNIIIVMTDQQRADLRAGCGYPLDTMPYLDRWAKNGVDFDQAYTPAPVCAPARVSMFTGRYPQSHRVRTNHNMDDLQYTKDLLDLIKEKGYRTALCGKNHSHRKPDDFDFCVLNGHLGNENGEDITTDEIEFGHFLNNTKHFETHMPSPCGVEVQHPYRNVSALFEFIDKSHSPFFAWLSFAEPHNPYQIPSPYYDMFPPESLPELTTSSIDLESKGLKFKWLGDTWKKIMGADFNARIQRARSNYHGMLRLIDDQFKRLITGLEERGLDDNTIVVYVSDHGDYVGEYGLLRKGADLPEVLTKIPMIWKGPGISSIGRHKDVCVSLVDILPTICDMLDMQIPFGCQGKSILPLLQGKGDVSGEFAAAYSENGYGGLYWTKDDNLDFEEEAYNGAAFDCLNTWTQCGQVRMIRKGRYKIQVDMMGVGYLYNLENDPFEIHNLWNDYDSLNVKADMLSSLISEMLKASDMIPSPRERYKTKQPPNGYWM